MKVKIEKILLIFILSLLPIFIFKGFFLPKIKDQALQHVKKNIEKQLNVEVLSQDIKINFWRGGVEFKKSYIKKNKEEKRPHFSIESIFVDSIEIDFSLLSFLYGKVKIKNIQFNRPQVHLIWHDSSNEPPSTLSGIDLRPLFKINKRIGIRRIFIQKANLYISRGESRKNIPYFEKIKVKNLNLRLEKLGKKLTLNINSESIFSHFNKKKKPFLIRLNFNINSILSEKDIEIRSLHISEIKKENHFINISGTLFNVSTLFKTRAVSLFSKINWEADDLSRLSELLLNRKPLPLKGTINLDTIIRVKNKKHNISFKINTENFYIFNYLLGNVYLFGSFKNKKIQLKKGHLHHPSGSIDFKKVELSFGNTLQLDTKFHIKRLQLKPFLQSLKIKKVPLQLETEGTFACNGDIYPKTLITCTSKQLETKNLKIFLEKNNTKKAIIESAPIEISGKTTISSNEINYQAFLKSDYGSCKSKGRIHYKKGFYIDFNSSHFKFKQFLEYITNLKIEGSSELIGYTKGTGRYAIVDIKSKVKNFWIEDYFLGDVKFHFKYKKGLMSFNHIKGKAFSTKYFGNINIDVYKSFIDGKIKFPHLDFSDLNKILIRKMSFPQNILGAGQSDMSWSGPLNLSKIKGSLSIKSKRIQFLDEFFSNAFFDIYWEKGVAYSKNIHLFKNKHILEIFGWINLKNHMEIKLKANDINLYEFSMISKRFLYITGKVDLEAEISGHISKPNIFIETQLKDMSSPKYHLGNSTIHIVQTNQFLKVKAYLFDNQVYLNTQIPYIKNKKFYFIFNTSNWNFSNIFPLFHKESFSDEYTSEITSNIELKSHSGNIQNIEGIAHLQKFLLKKENAWLQNTKPITISVKNGSIKNNTFYFKGDEDSFLKFESKKSFISDLNFKLQLKSNLSLFSFLFPFLEDIGGSFLADLNIKKDLLSPKLNGDINFENIFVKIYNIKHLIENININAKVKNNNITINSLSGSFAENPIQGEGKIEFKKIREIPLDINIKLKTYLLEIPKDVITSGLLQFRFYGKWFPYNLKGIYNIDGGIISKEFNQNKDKQKNYFAFQKDPYNFNMEINVLNRKGIKIQNSQFDGKIKGDFLIAGSIENPFLLNSIEIEPESKIFFRDHFFNIDSGYINFDNKEKNNPDIFINGSTEIRKYKINFTAKERADNPKIIFTSIPTLPEKDIISLILTNKTLQELEINNAQKSEEIITNSSYQIGASLITKKILKKQFNKELGLDIKVDSNLNKDNNVSETRITLGRKITKDLNIKASRSLGENIFNEVKMEYQMNNSMSTIGGWRGRESRNLNSRGSNQQSILSLDLQYQINFK